MLAHQLGYPLPIQGDVRHLELGEAPAEIQVNNNTANPAPERGAEVSCGVVRYEKDPSLRSLAGAQRGSGNERLPDCQLC